MSDCKTSLEYEDTAFHYGRLEDSLCGIQRQKQKILNTLLQVTPTRSGVETDIAYLDKLRRLGYSIEYPALITKAREVTVSELAWHKCAILETQQKVKYYEECKTKPNILTMMIINCCKARLLLHSVFVAELEFNLETIDLLLRSF